MTTPLTGIKSFLNAAEVTELRNTYMDAAETAGRAILEARTSGHMGRAADCLSWFLLLAESPNPDAHERIAWFCWKAREISGFSLDEKIANLYAAALERYKKDASAPNE